MTPREVWRRCNPKADVKTAEGRAEIRRMVRAAAAVDRRSEAWVERHCRRLNAWEI